MVSAVVDDPCASRYRVGLVSKSLHDLFGKLALDVKLDCLWVGVEVVVRGNSEVGCFEHCFRVDWLEFHWWSATLQGSKQPGRGLDLFLLPLLPVFLDAQCSKTLPKPHEFHGGIVQYYKCWLAKYRLDLDLALDSLYSCVWGESFKTKLLACEFNSIIDTFYKHL